jgi:hypothetical protein
MSEPTQYNSKYDEVFGFGAALVVCLVAMVYLFIQACNSQTDPLHYNLVFGFFSALLTCAFAYRTQVALRDVKVQ